MTSAPCVIRGCEKGADDERFQIGRSNPKQSSARVGAALTTRTYHNLPHLRYHASNVGQACSSSTERSTSTEKFHYVTCRRLYLGLECLISSFLTLPRKQRVNEHQSFRYVAERPFRRPRKSSAMHGRMCFEASTALLGNRGNIWIF